MSSRSSWTRRPPTCGKCSGTAAPDRPQPKDVKTRIEILHPGDDDGNGLVRHCYFPVPKWLLSRGVGQSWEWLTEVKPYESWRYDAVGKPLWSHATGGRRLTDLGDGRTRVTFIEEYEAFNPFMRVLFEKPVHDRLSRDNDTILAALEGGSEAGTASARRAKRRRRRQRRPSLNGRLFVYGTLCPAERRVARARAVDDRATPAYDAVVGRAVRHRPGLSRRDLRAAPSRTRARGRSSTLDPARAGAALAALDRYEGDEYERIAVRTRGRARRGDLRLDRTARRLPAASRAGHWATRP